jgi:hypothetical protein
MQARDFFETIRLLTYYQLRGARPLTQSTGGRRWARHGPSCVSSLSATCGAVPKRGHLKWRRATQRTCRAALTHTTRIPRRRRRWLDVTCTRRELWRATSMRSILYRRRCDPFLIRLTDVATTIPGGDWPSNSPPSRPFQPKGHSRIVLDCDLVGLPTFI